MVLGFHHYARSLNQIQKNKLLMDQVPVPFPSGKQRRQDRRNGKEGMRRKLPRAISREVWYNFFEKVSDLM